MAKKAMNSYRVVVERDESSAWIARVPSIPGCHTYGRTLEAARRRMREALGLWIEHPERARLDFEVRLPGRVKAAVRPVETARARADKARFEAQDVLVGAAKTLIMKAFPSEMRLRSLGSVINGSHKCWRPRSADESQAERNAVVVASCSMTARAILKRRQRKR